MSKKKKHLTFFHQLVSLGILHMMADLEELFVSNFLRKLDTDEATLCNVFRLSQTFTKSMNDLKTPLFDSFLGGLSEDDHGNVKYEKFDEKGNTIMLNHQHQHSQRTMSKIELINEESKELKGSIIANLIKNVEDQSQK